VALAPAITLPPAGVGGDQRCTLRREVLNAEWFATTRQASNSSINGYASTTISGRTTLSACDRHSAKQS